MTTLPTYLRAADQVSYIEPYEVCEKLLAVNPSKTCGPDNIPGRLLKEFAHLFAEPVANIFNTSLSSGIVSNIWKDSYITLELIPKIKQPTDEADTRPNMISLKGSSTTYCLLDMFHSWLSHLDSPGHYFRICFLDFSKPFDRIVQNVFIRKLVDIGVRS